VRELARRAGLDVADKAESQDLCFLAGVGRRIFLERHGAPATAGELVDTAGRVLGRHDGQRQFTVGQRRGIGVGAPEPLNVLAKDATSGRVTVGPRTALAATRVTVAPARLHRDARRVDRVKLRYRSRPLACRVTRAATRGEHASLELSLSEPADAVAPGQTACLLEGRRVVGWGTIQRSNSGEERVAA
jgi:tRNA-specific 2-thiouridylase